MSEPNTRRFLDSLALFVDICRFRAGPEDVPVSARLLGVAIGGSVALRAALLGVLPQPFEGSPAVIIAIGVGVPLLFIAALLRIARRPERFLQTATAIFGCQLVLAPLQHGASWLLLSLGEDPTWRPLALMLRFAADIWILAIVARILHSATQWPLFSCVALAIASEFLTLLAIAGVFPQLVAAPAPA